MSGFMEQSAIDLDSDRNELGEEPAVLGWPEAFGTGEVLATFDTLLRPQQQQAPVSDMQRALEKLKLRITSDANASRLAELRSKQRLVESLSQRPPSHGQPVRANAQPLDPKNSSDVSTRQIPRLIQVSDVLHGLRRLPSPTPGAPAEPPSPSWPFALSSPIATRALSPRALTFTDVKSTPGTERTAANVNVPQANSLSYTVSNATSITLQPHSPSPQRQNAPRALPSRAAPETPTTTRPTSSTPGLGPSRSPTFMAAMAAVTAPSDPPRGRYTQPAPQRQRPYSGAGQQRNAAPTTDSYQSPSVSSSSSWEALFTRPIRRAFPVTTRQPAAAAPPLTFASNTVTSPDPGTGWLADRLGGAANSGLQLDDPAAPPPALVSSGWTERAFADTTAQVLAQASRPGPGPLSLQYMRPQSTGRRYLSPGTVRNTRDDAAAAIVAMLPSASDGGSMRSSARSSSAVRPSAAAQGGSLDSILQAWAPVTSSAGASAAVGTRPARVEPMPAWPLSSVNASSASVSSISGGVNRGPGAYSSSGVSVSGGGGGGSRGRYMAPQRAWEGSVVGYTSGGAGRPLSVGTEFRRGTSTASPYITPTPFTLESGMEVVTAGGTADAVELRTPGIVRPLSAPRVLMSGRQAAMATAAAAGGYGSRYSAPRNPGVPVATDSSSSSSLVTTLAMMAAGPPQHQLPYSTQSSSRSSALSVRQDGRPGGAVASVDFSGGRRSPLPQKKDSRSAAAWPAASVASSKSSGAIGTAASARYPAPQQQQEQRQLDGEVSLLGNIMSAAQRLQSVLLLDGSADAAGREGLASTPAAANDGDGTDSSPRVRPLDMSAAWAAASAGGGGGGGGGGASTSEILHNLGAFITTTTVTATSTSSQSRPPQSSPLRRSSPPPSPLLASHDSNSNPASPLGSPIYLAAGVRSGSRARSSSSPSDPDALHFPPAPPLAPGMLLPVPPAIAIPQGHLLNPLVLPPGPLWQQPIGAAASGSDNIWLPQQSYDDMGQDQRSQHREEDDGLEPRSIARMPSLTLSPFPDTSTRDRSPPRNLLSSPLQQQQERRQNVGDGGLSTPLTTSMASEIPYLERSRAQSEQSSPTRQGSPGDAEGSAGLSALLGFLQQKFQLRRQRQRAAKVLEGWRQAAANDDYSNGSAADGGGGGGNGDRMSRQDDEGLRMDRLERGTKRSLDASPPRGLRTSLSSPIDRVSIPAASTGRDGGTSDMRPSWQNRSISPTDPSPSVEPYGGSAGKGATRGSATDGPRSPAAAGSGSSRGPDGATEHGVSDSSYGEVARSAAALLSPKTSAASVNELQQKLLEQLKELRLLESQQEQLEQRFSPLRQRGQLTPQQAAQMQQQMDVWRLQQERQLVKVQKQLGELQHQLLIHYHQQQQQLQHLQLQQSQQQLRPLSAAEGLLVPGMSLEQRLIPGSSGSRGGAANRMDASGSGVSLSAAANGVLSPSSSSAVFRELHQMVHNMERVLSVMHDDVNYINDISVKAVDSGRSGLVTRSPGLLTGTAAAANANDMFVRKYSGPQLGRARDARLAAGPWDGPDGAGRKSGQADSNQQIVTAAAPSSGVGGAVVRGSTSHARPVLTGHQPSAAGGRMGDPPSPAGHRRSGGVGGGSGEAVREGAAGFGSSGDDGRGGGGGKQGLMLKEVHHQPQTQPGPSKRAQRILPPPQFLLQRPTNAVSKPGPGPTLTAAAEPSHTRVAPSDARSAAAGPAVGGGGGGDGDGNRRLAAHLLPSGGDDVHAYAATSTVALADQVRHMRSKILRVEEQIQPAIYHTATAGAAAGTVAAVAARSPTLERQPPLPLSPVNSIGHDSSFSHDAKRGVASAPYLASPRSSEWADLADERRRKARSVPQAVTVPQRVPGPAREVAAPAAPPRALNKGAHTGGPYDRGFSGDASAAAVEGASVAVAPGSVAASVAACTDTLLARAAALRSNFGLAEEHLADPQAGLRKTATAAGVTPAGRGVGEESWKGSSVGPAQRPRQAAPSITGRVSATAKLPVFGAIGGVDAGGSRGYANGWNGGSDGQGLGGGKGGGVTRHVDALEAQLMGELGQLEDALKRLKNPGGGNGNGVTVGPRARAQSRGHA